VEEGRRRYQFAAAVYGSILVAALVGATFEEQASARTITLSLAGTVVIFWVAHAWSEVVGERVADGRMFDPARIKAITIEEWPLVEAGMLPVLLLGARVGRALLAPHRRRARPRGRDLPAGDVGRGRRRRTQPTWAGALVVGVFDGLLGIAIVAIEIAVHR
jgi:hypothetical protein